MKKFTLGVMTGIAAMAAIQAAVLVGGSVAAQPQGGMPPPAGGDPMPPAGAGMPPMPKPVHYEPQRCSREQEAANKNFVVGTAPPTPDTLYNKMAPDYIQHSPDSLRFMQLNNTYGKAGMALLRQAFDQLHISYGAPRNTGAPMPRMNSVVIAECDLVFTLSQMYLPDPTKPGSYYPAFGFDLWRVKDGKLAEHWDGMRISNPPPAYLAAPLAQLKPGAKAN